MDSVIEIVNKQTSDPHSDVPLRMILPRVAIMARVLQLPAFSDWLKSEVSGYSDHAIVPDYRRPTNTTLIAWMPGNGWAQVSIEDEDKERIYKGHITQGVEAVEAAYSEHRKSGGANVEFSEEEEAEFQKHTNMHTRLQLSIPVSNFERILASTRATIAVWTADMLEHDVVGHSLNFSNAEKADAQALFDKLPSYQEIAQGNVELRMERTKPKAGLIGRLFGR